MTATSPPNRPTRCRRRAAPAEGARRARPAPARCSTAPSSAGRRSTRFVKLDPRTLAKNPVMFVVEVGSVLTTILFLRDLGVVQPTSENVFAGLVVVFLWFTVLFANFAEAMAEGRGKAQAATLRKTRSETDGPRPPRRRPRRGGPVVAAAASATCASSPPAR